MTGLQSLSPKNALRTNNCQHLLRNSCGHWKVDDEKPLMVTFVRECFDITTQGK